MAELDVAAADEFPPGSTKIVQHDSLFIGVYNCGGELYAIEDRCSHDDGPLCEGDWDEDLCRVVCPRHGSQFELSTGRPISLPAAGSALTCATVASTSAVSVWVIVWTTAGWDEPTGTSPIQAVTVGRRVIVEFVEESLSVWH